MKICYLAVGKVHVQRWMRYFAKAGHEVHLITSDESIDVDSMDYANVWKLKGFGRRGHVLSYLVNLPLAAIQLKRLIRKMQPDIIHTHGVGGAISLLGAMCGFHPLVATPWGSDVLVTPKKFRLLGLIVKYVCRRADLITTDAEHVKELLIRQFGVDSGRVSLINFGTNVSEFSAERRDITIRKEWGILNSAVIISSRRLHPIYDVESLINAMPEVLKKVPEAKLIIIGDGSQRGELEKLTKLIGVSDSVKFLGWIFSDELPQYIASADIYISTSLSDAGLASSTAEAMACELPVIVTDVGDNRKWVEDGVNGFIIPLRDHEALALKIIYLLKHKDVRERFGQLNRRIIEERSNWEKEMRKMGYLYEELINEFEGNKCG